MTLSHMHFRLIVVELLMLILVTSFFWIFKLQYKLKLVGRNLKIIGAKPKKIRAKPPNSWDETSVISKRQGCCQSFSKMKKMTIHKDDHLYCGCK